MSPPANRPPETAAPPTSVMNSRRPPSGPSSRGSYPTMLRAALCITANSGCQCPLYPQKRTLADTYQRWCVGTQPNKSRGADRCRHPQKSQEFRRSDDPLNGERMASKGSSARAQKRRFVGVSAMSALCQRRTYAVRQSTIDCCQWRS